MGADNKIDLSERIDVEKADGSCQCIICHYWCFLDINFKFRQEVCNNCHDLMHKAISFNDFAMASVIRNDYRIHFLYMSKNKAINSFKNVDLTAKSGTL